MAKTLSFAVMQMTIAFSVVYLLTGDVLAGGAVALIEPLCNTVAFYFHEKLWRGGAPRRWLDAWRDRGLHHATSPSS